MDFVAKVKILVSYIIQVHYMNNSKHKCMHYLSIKENWNQLHYLIHCFWFLLNENVIKRRIQIISKDSKVHLYCIQSIFWFFNWINMTSLYL
jgi:hypothetical protein